MSLTPEQRRLRARLAAQARWARTEDRSAATRAARDALAAKWDAAPDPAAAKAAHMARMAYASSRARSA
jgi:hypothetical protein